MSNPTDMMIAFEEKDRTIIERLDEMARTEGTSRSALIRRAIRQMVFSVSKLPESDKMPQADTFKEVA